MPNLTSLYVTMVDYIMVLSLSKFWINFLDATDFDVLIAKTNPYIWVEIIPIDILTPTTNERKDVCVPTQRLITFFQNSWAEEHILTFYNNAGDDIDVHCTIWPVERFHELWWVTPRLIVCMFSVVMATTRHTLWFLYELYVAKLQYYLFSITAH